MTPQVDVRNGPALSDALTQVWVFAEYVNLACASALRGTERQPPPLGALLELARDHAMADNRDRRASCAALALAADAGISLRTNPEIIEPLIVRLREPARRLKVGSTIDWRLFRLTEPNHYYAVDGVTDFATRRLPERDTSGHERSSTNYYWDEFLDPVAVAHDFLVNVLKVREAAAPHYVQRWLRDVSGIVYRRDKYLLKGVAERFNVIFFGDPLPSRVDVHTSRSTTVGLRLLVDELRRLVKSYYDEEKLADDRIANRVGLGFYLLLRFCRILRCRYRWSDQDRSGFAPRQCISALRTLEYSYFGTKVFGAMSGIRGLNSVFRGGLLPKTHGGRTFVVRGNAGAGKSVFALHMLADMASRGRFAIYFSFEEGNDAILDRLWTFGLIDREKFNIANARGDIHTLIVQARKDDPNKGLLVLYGREDAEKFDVGHELDSIVESIEAAMKEAPGHDWRWRALALDSINALEFGPGGPRRVVIQHLIDKIERLGFWGLLVSEAERELESLPYLADTVVNLGFADGRQVRTLEIAKCRTQNYQPGPHAFRLAGGRGVVIYPSLGAVQSSLRRRVKSALSEQWMVPLPGELPERLTLDGVEEKSATLIWGPPNSGKTVFLVHVATAPSRLTGRLGTSASGRERLPDLLPPSSILFVSFQTTEINLSQTVRRYDRLSELWRPEMVRRRWYSPGDNMTAGQLIADVWQRLQRARRAAVPIDRVVFHGVGAAEELLPALRDEPLFWPTLLDLLATEAVTSFFVADAEDGRNGVVQRLRGGVDYVFHLYRKDQPSRMWIDVEKRPTLRFENQAEIQLDPNGAIR